LSAGVLAARIVGGQFPLTFAFENQGPGGISLFVKKELLALNLAEYIPPIYPTAHVKTPVVFPDRLMGTSAHMLVRCRPTNSATGILVSVAKASRIKARLIRR
jgi:hypothetical protein